MLGWNVPQALPGKFAGASVSNPSWDYVRVADGSPGISGCVWLSGKLRPNQSKMLRPGARIRAS